MLTFFLFALAAIGLTNILVHGKILDDDHIPLRSWLKSKLGRFADVLECYECTGWWSGLIVGLLLISWNPFIFIPCTFAGAGLMHFYVIITNLLESKTDFVVGVEDEAGTTDQTTTE
jgi:hypothetical protein